MKIQQSNDALTQSTNEHIFVILPIVLAILLICRLDGAYYSAFIIALPIFVIVGCCCCSVFCTIYLLACVDLDEMSDPFSENKHKFDADNLDANVTENLQSAEPFLHCDRKWRIDMCIED